MGHINQFIQKQKQKILNTKRAVSSIKNITLPMARLVQCSSKYIASCMELVTNIRSASMSSPCHSQQIYVIEMNRLHTYSTYIYTGTYIQMNVITVSQF